MSINKEIDNFFNEYGEYFDKICINYTKTLVQKIKTSDTLKKFLSQNNISASILLNEITPYSNYKLKQYGDEKLNDQELQSVLNIIIFSNEIEKLILDDHIQITSIGESGELYYTPDKFTVEYFLDKYNIKLKENEEFDFTILDETDIDNFSDYDFGIN